jgi:hypothetical protein
MYSSGLTLVGAKRYVARWSRALALAVFVLSLFASVGTARAQLMEEIWLIAADGTLYSGSAEWTVGSYIFPGSGYAYTPLGNINSITALSGGGNAFLIAGAYAVIVVEVAVAGYLTYQLVDAAFDYSSANTINQQLQQKVQTLQNQIAQQYPNSCACLMPAPPGTPLGAWQQNPYAWWDQGTDEWSCTHQGGTPNFCYDSFPLKPNVFATFPNNLLDGLFGAPNTTLGSLAAYLSGYRGLPVQVACPAGGPCLPAN